MGVPPGVCVVRHTQPPPPTPPRIRMDVLPRSNNGVEFALEGESYQVALNLRYETSRLDCARAFPTPQSSAMTRSIAIYPPSFGNMQRREDARPSPKE